MLYNMTLFSRNARNITFLHFDGKMILREINFCHPERPQNVPFLTNLEPLNLNKIEK